MSSVSDEVRLFGRMATFGLVVGVGYWLLTGERAGAVLLVAFGLASGLAAVALFVGSRRGRRTKRSEAAGEPEAVEPAAVEPDAEPVPEPGWAPLVIAAGIGGLALGGAFGPWLTIAGLLVAILGGWAWLSAAMREFDAAEGPPPEA
ncbi:MAG: Cytochrome c oxidase subunit [Chloroflexota bacterium]|nr:Cytochrome c oxidase subunit [Chloroflexota bacterium]